MTWLPLHRNFFFGVTLFVLTAILTAINNHYYYADREIQTSRLHRDLISTIDHIYRHCIAGGNAAASCQQQLATAIEAARWPGAVTIKGASDTLLLNINNQRYRDGRTTVTTSRKIGPDQTSLEVNIDQNVTPALLSSVVRSMTFSMADIASSLWRGDSWEELRNFITYVAIPRSRPSFFFLLTMIAVTYLVHMGIRSLLIRIDSLEDKKTRLQSELNRHEEKREDLERELKKNESARAELEDERALLTMEIEQLEANQSNTKNNEAVLHHKAEIQRLRRKLENSSEANKELAGVITSIESERNRLLSSEKKLQRDLDLAESQRSSLEKNKVPVQDSIRRNLTRILLTNPEVPTGLLRRTNQGKHHSKDYLAKLTTAIEQIKMECNAVASLTSHKYEPHKRKTIQVQWLEDKKKFGLIVTSPGDEGFAAEITLHATEYWQALLDAKYMVEMVRMLKDYTIKP